MCIFKLLNLETYVCEFARNIRNSTIENKFSEKKNEQRKKEIVKANIFCVDFVVNLKQDIIF